MRCYNCKNSNWRKTEKDYECYRMAQCLMEDVNKREKYSEMGIKVGSKIRFKGEKRFWRVTACNDRFVIGVRNHRGKWYYTICDLQECIRGADDHYGYFDYENLGEEEAEIALAQFGLSDYSSIDKLPVSKKAKKWFKNTYYIEPDESLDKKQLKLVNAEWANIPALEISYRDWVDLDIEEVR